MWLGEMTVPDMTIAIEWDVKQQTKPKQKISFTMTNKGCVKGRFLIHVFFLVYCAHFQYLDYSKTCLKYPSKRRPKIGFQYRLSLNAGQKYCRMPQESILQYFRPSLSYHLSLRPLFCLFYWPLKTGFTVLLKGGANIFL